MYKIVILFTVEQIFAYKLKVSKFVISFVSTFRKVTRAVIDLVDSFYTYGTDKLTSRLRSRLILRQGDKTKSITDYRCL